LDGTDDIISLNNAIKTRYPNLIYTFKFIWQNDHTVFKEHLLNMKLNEDDDEVKRIML
jgi:hypothetical protein